MNHGPDGCFHAGVVPIAHDSAGPREDIVIPELAGSSRGEEEDVGRPGRGGERGSGGGGKAGAKEQIITGYR